MKRRRGRYNKRPLPSGFIKSTEFVFGIKRHLNECGEVLIRRHKRHYRITIEPLPDVDRKEATA